MFLTIEWSTNIFLLLTWFHSLKLSFRYKCKHNPVKSGLSCFTNLFENLLKWLSFENKVYNFFFLVNRYITTWNTEKRTLGFLHIGSPNPFGLPPLSNNIVGFSLSFKKDYNYWQKKITINIFKSLQISQSKYYLHI